MYASEVFINPTYGGLEEGADLALLYFENPFLTVGAIDLYTGSLASLVGQDASFSGYGAPAIVGGTLQPLDGVRRAGTNVVTTVSPVEGEFIQATFLPSTFTDGRPLGALATEGNSGGAWRILTDDGPVLIGITSFATSNLRYGGSTFATPISSNIDWIKNTM